MPRGVLLGFARIVGVVTRSDDIWYQTGKIGIELDDVTAYPGPVPMRGNQGYWPVLDGLSLDEREDLDERAGMRAYHGDMPVDEAQWWALYDVVRRRG